MIALLLKEFQAASAYLYAVALGLLFVVLDHVLPAMGDWSRSRVLEHQNVDWVFLSGLLAFALGHRTVAHEYRDGHIEFLDGLPVHRWQVFLSKVVVVALPLAVLVVGTVAIKGLTVWALGVPGGVGAGETLAVLGLRLTVCTAVFASLGMLTSWVGGLGWGAVVMLTFGMLTLSIVVPSARPYVLMDGMVEFDFAQGRPVHQWGPLVVWSVLSIAAVGVSGLLFLGPGKWLVKAGTWSTALVRVAGIGCGAFLFLSCAGLASIQVVVSQASKMLTPTERVSTEHFRVLYPTQSAEEARPLVADIDAISAEVGRMMGHEEPLELEVEMMGSGRAHAGRFVGGKITMALGPDARATLAHELSHAHAFSMSGWAVQHQFEHLRFFEEGMAQYFENAFMGTEPEPQLAAAMWKTGQARFDLLVEDTLRGQNHDSDQAYPLGEVFVQALVQTAGPGSIRCLLQSFGETGEAEVSGLGLWVRATSDCDIDLDQVVAAYDEMLAREADDLPVLPDLAWRIDRDGREVSVADNASTGMELVCRFRDDAETERYQWEQTRVIEGACSVPRSSLSGTSYELQVGFVLPGHQWPVYLEWAQVHR